MTARTRRRKRRPIPRRFAVSFLERQQLAMPTGARKLIRPSGIRVTGIDDLVFLAPVNDDHLAEVQGMRDGRLPDPRFSVSPTLRANPRAN